MKQFRLRQSPYPVRTRFWLAHIESNRRLSQSPFFARAQIIQKGPSKGWSSESTWERVLRYPGGQARLNSAFQNNMT